VLFQLTKTKIISVRS